MIERKLISSKIEKKSETKFNVIRIYEETRTEEMTIGELEQAYGNMLEEREKVIKGLSGLDESLSLITQHIETAKELQKGEAP